MKIDLGSLVTRSFSMPAYFVALLQWMFTIVMIFGSMLCGVILAAPKLRAQMPFLGRLADDLRPFRGLIGLLTAISSFIRLFWVPFGTVFVEDMLPGLLGAAAGAIVFLDWWKARQATDLAAAPTGTLPEAAAMGLGIGAAVIGFIHMFVGWHAPVL